MDKAIRERFNEGTASSRGIPGKRSLAPGGNAVALGRGGRIANVETAPSSANNGGERSIVRRDTAAISRRC
jgi:hypothetical protein